MPRLLSQMLLLPALLSVMTLTACKTTGTTDSGLTIVKPSSLQIQSAAKTVVCDSFSSVTYAYDPKRPDDSDTLETINQIRRNNAAYRAYGCK